MAESQISELLATVRPRAGKGAARAARRDGKVPAVVYGDKKESEAIAVDYNDVVRLLRRGELLSNVFDIKVDGRSVRALTRDVQFDPVKDLPLHIDFQRVAADGRIRVMVPVEVINEEIAPGIKRGGMLNMVRHEVEVYCPADNIPESLIIDLTGGEIGDSFHISAVKLPEGVSPTITDRDFTIVTLAGSAAARSEADEDEDGEAKEDEEREEKEDDKKE
ncbi:MAG TPA: 50S ribosomal protein L25/general stress protein Ctc [Hyphomicrobiaceae bacterium]|nr:50S ribosomal protein L25/general stress protein Ctc [Hyphomicrobiaceae bacterium]